jgi:Rrf2 family protein
MSQSVEWALHSCTLLALLADGAALPATRLAEFHDLPPAYLAKGLQALARDGIVATSTGPKGGYRLARNPEHITLLDVVDAVEGSDPAFRCTEIRRRGPAGCPPQAYRRKCGIALAMATAEAAWRAELQRQTIGDLVVDMIEHVPQDAARKGASWLEQVVP